MVILYACAIEFSCEFCVLCPANRFYIDTIQSNCCVFSNVATNLLFFFSFLFSFSKNLISVFSVLTDGAFAIWG